MVKFELHSHLLLKQRSFPSPTADQLKSEWSASAMRGVETSENEVIFYQSPHQYGTNTT